MNIVLCSIFRNAGRYLDRYFTKIESLEFMLRKQGHSLSLNLVHGDSCDETGQLLQDYSAKRNVVSLQEVNHGGVEYGSRVNATRFKNLALVCNALWSAIPGDADVVLYLESDLIWEADTLVQLVNNHQTLSSLVYPIVLSPMVYTAMGSFYDTWAFRKDGISFTPASPYHPAIQYEDRLISMDSVGSVFCVDGLFASSLSWPEEDVVVGLCNQARQLGATIFVDKMLRVYHP